MCTDRYFRNIVARRRSNGQSRAAVVKVRAQTIDGEWKTYDAEELLARAFQHEIDHLDGVLFIFRVSALKRDLIQRRIRKLQKTGEW